MGAKAKKTTSATTTATPAPDVTARSPKELAAALAAFQPKAEHWRYLRAFVDVLHDGGQVTHKAIAKKLGFHRESVSRRFGKTPELELWINEQLKFAMGALHAPVVRRLGLIALRKGSVAHAELYLKAIGELRDSAAPFGAGATVNILIGGVPVAVTADQWPGGVLEAPKR
jgi:hypothetical protein